MPLCAVYVRSVRLIAFVGCAVLCPCVYLLYMHSFAGRSDLFASLDANCRSKYLQLPQVPPDMLPEAAEAQMQSGGAAGGAQAQRLVKNSILAIEAPEEEVDDEDWVPDAEEVEEMVQRARRAEGDGPGSPDRSPGGQGPPQGPRSPDVDQGFTLLPL